MELEKTKLNTTDRGTSQLLKSQDGLEVDKNFYYVKDNGVGFPMDHAKNLFEVFERLHPVEEIEGSGLGLAIVKRVIHQHEGEVWAEGRVDEGGTFYFSIPGEHLK